MSMHNGENMGIVCFTGLDPGHIQRWLGITQGIVATKKTEVNVYITLENHHAIHGFHG